MSNLRAGSPRDARPYGILRLGETTIATWVPQASVRPPVPLQDPAWIHLHLIESGSVTSEALYAEHDSVGSLVAGQAFFTQGAPELMVRGSREARLVTVSVPNEIIPQRSMEMSTPLSRVRSDSGLLSPIEGFLARLGGIDAVELSGVARYYLERLLHEMIVALWVDLDRFADLPRGRDVFAQALSLIAAQCADRSLSPTHIARDVSLSLRQLERVFSEQGTTIGAAIRRARVEQAISLLKRVEYDGLSIDQIAGYSGFVNGSSLARAMRASGHPPPARVRSTRLR